MLLSLVSFLYFVFVVFCSGISGRSVLQHLLLPAHHHGGAGMDNDREGDVRASLLDTQRRRLLLVSLDTVTTFVVFAWMFAATVWLL